MKTRGLGRSVAVLLAAGTLLVGCENYGKQIEAATTRAEDAARRAEAAASRTEASAKRAEAAATSVEQMVSRAMARHR